MLSSLEMIQPEGFVYFYNFNCSLNFANFLSISKSGFFLMPPTLQSLKSKSEHIIFSNQKQSNVWLSTLYLRYTEFIKSFFLCQMACSSPLFYRFLSYKHPKAQFFTKTLH